MICRSTPAGGRVLQRSFLVLGWPLLAGLAASASGPDVIVADVIAPVNYATLDGVDAISAGVQYCNVGDAQLDHYASTPRHPVITQNLYRYSVVGGVSRFEQIGMSWVYHTTIPVSQAACGTCSPLGSDQLGFVCSTSDTASSLGVQSSLRPRSAFNASSGAFPFPQSLPGASGAIARRLQFRTADVDPQRDGGDAYFIELIVVAPDDATSGNGANNVSHRRCVFTGSGESWNAAVSGATTRESPAVAAWASLDAGVQLLPVDVPGDGRFVLAARVVRTSQQSWSYEYALLNQNSHASAASLAVPADDGVTLSGIGFHDVDYHSGDGATYPTNYDAADWAVTRETDRIRWNTQADGENANANALRWGTLYNFRFVADAPPSPASAAVGLYRGSGTVSIPGVPSPASCAGDLNRDRVVDLTDLAVLLAHFGGDGATREDGDLSRDGRVDLTDLAILLSRFGVAC